MVPMLATSGRMAHQGILIKSGIAYIYTRLTDIYVYKFKEYCVTYPPALKSMDDF